jgi:hypothetical protein
MELLFVIYRALITVVPNPYDGSRYHSMINRLSGDVNKAGRWSKEDETAHSQNGGLS